MTALFDKDCHSERRGGPLCPPDNNEFPSQQAYYSERRGGPLCPPNNTVMKAAMFYKPEDVRFEETPMPAPAPGEMIIKVEVALTCGTDLKTFRRGHPVLLKSYPSPFGHECSGRVHAIGEGVNDFNIGDRVVAANSAPCMNCFYCGKGKFNLCESLDLLNGAYAEYLKVPARIVAGNTLQIPQETESRAAAFAEPLAVSMRGIDACNIKSGDSVAVIGLGAVGQFLVRLAKLKGAYVTGLGRNQLKRTLAKSFGNADVVLDMRDFSTPRQIVEKFTPGGHGFDVVIEAVGLPQTWENAVHMVRRGGLVNLFGGCERGSTVTFDTGRLHYDEITLISMFHHTPEYFRKALAAISSGQIDPTLLITHELPLSSIVEALELVSAGKALKIALIPPT